MSLATPTHRPVHLSQDLTTTGEVKARAALDETPNFRQFLTFLILSGVRLSPFGTAATIVLLYQPQMIDDGDCGAIGGMKIGRENRSTRRKPTQCHFIHNKSHRT
jgi:hypothetical protein